MRIARTLLRRILAGGTLLLASLGLCAPADAGDLAHADLARRFQPPLHVGDKLRYITAWPITSEALRRPLSWMNRRPRGSGLPSGPDISRAYAA